MEGNFNFKNFKPTNDTPTPAGKQVDTYFRKQLGSTGMKLREETMLAESETSLKKKIFKLDKMETLVHTDEKLSDIFNQLKGEDPEIKWGYHWSEVLNNIIFNNYVLNDPTYLSKYKDTKAKMKTRRGEEGVKELQNDIEKEKEASTSAADRKSELQKDEVNELFGFGAPKVDAPVQAQRRSKNDTYFVDLRNNKLLGAVPYAASPEQKQEIIGKFVGNPNAKQISWYEAAKKGIQGVPTEVADGSLQAMDAEFAKKYPQRDSMVSLREESVEETTGAASSGSFAAPLTKDEEITETTTSASSGQYSGPRIWAKNPENSRFAKKAAYKDGIIVGESVVHGDKEYLTNPAAFKKYVVLSQLNESIEEAETFQQHSQKMLNKIIQAGEEFPDLKNDPHYHELVKTHTERAKGQGQQKPASATVGTTPNPVVAEHHLTSTDAKIDFIIQNSDFKPEQLAVMNDNEVEMLYAMIERNMGIAENNHDSALKQDLKNTGNAVTANASEKELESKDGLFKGRWNENNGNQTADLANAIDHFKKYPESPDFKNGFIEAKEFIKSKVGEIKRMPQLKMWLDQNMPQLSNYVTTLWGNWDLLPSNNMTENVKKMSIKEQEYKNYLKSRIKESGKSFGTMNESDKKSFLKEAYAAYVLTESLIDNQPDSMINNQETSMVKSMDSDEVNTTAEPALPPTADGGITEAGYDTDDLGAKASIKDKFADYSDEEGGEEEATADVAVASEPVAKEKAYYHSGSEDSETVADAKKFKDMLIQKFGVDDVSQLSHAERAELMKSMNFAPEKKNAPSLDVTQFKTADADKDAFFGQDQKRLDFLLANADRVSDLAGYQAVASEFNAANAESGEKMFHPMAILASIQKFPKGSPERQKYAGIEGVLASQIKETAPSINEDRKTSSILNVEKLGKENARNFATDSKEEDALDQNKTYPSAQPADSIQKAAVYPNPKDFYIEQDLEKVQKDAPTLAGIEKEVLAKTKGMAFVNVGDSTNEKGNEITKRNLTKPEAYSLAMNRGDGMHNIVYDAKPSDRFEKRMEQDMGDDVYKARQEKFKYRASAPMYNKDTQPTEKGDKTIQDDKFIKGYNSESVNAKYTDELGKLKLIEFAMANVKDVIVNDKAEFSRMLAEGEVGYKLSLSGLGNKYNLSGKKLDENKEFAKIVESVEFYYHNGDVLAVNKSDIVEVSGKPVINESAKMAALDKMKKLMNYNPKNYVDPKKSVKY